MQDQDKTKEQIIEELADLRQRVAQLQRFCGDLDAFTYTVAHDLKRPLSLIIGYSDLLIDEYEIMPKEELSECLQAIDQAATEPCARAIGRDGLARADARYAEHGQQRRQPRRDQADH